VRGHTADVVIYSKFHRNQFMGFGAPGGRNLPIPIMLAIEFYNSLHYRASRDDTSRAVVYWDKKSQLLVVSKRHNVIVPVFELLYPI